MTGPVRRQDGDAPESEAPRVFWSPINERFFAEAGAVMVSDISGTEQPPEDGVELGPRVSPSESEAVAILRELVARVNGCSCPCDCDYDDILDRAEALLSAAPETRTGPSEEAIERAAKAAHRAFFGEYPIRGWDEIDREHRKSWFAVARAVADALRAEA